jgi:diketogulonate reductase-like aldo/keto reductase
MIFDETYTLSNGVTIPKLGLGTWMIDDASVSEAVRQAVSIGYRHIDTAQAYGNEAGVGKGIRTCGVPRGEIFVTSKVAAEAKSYAAAAQSIATSLEKLSLDYIDMMIIHSPQPWAEWRSGNRYFDENKEAWRALEDAYQAGKLKAVGVSNFLVDDLENLLAGCAVKPMVNQILTHVGNTPLDVIRFCQDNGMVVEAYSPIAHGEALRNAQIAAMADKYGVSVAQLCIKYVLELGAVALPKTANPAHMQANAQLDFTLSEEDMELLKAFTSFEDYGEHSRFPVFSGR